MTVTYGIMALVAAILLIGYSVLIGKKEPWLLLQRNRDRSLHLR